MQYLHTMIRVSDLEKSLDFYCNTLGLIETNRYNNEDARFTLVFLAAPDDVAHAKENKTPLLELTYNWDEKNYKGGRNFGHLAFRVDNIYDTCKNLVEKGVVLNRPPRDGHMAFIKSPDGISIELLQKGNSLPEQEPWIMMDNQGTW